jgi:hypothetical protein
MQAVVQWLEALGLGQYGDAFIGADIDLVVLPDLTEADLAQLGVTLGHRKRLLRAIAALRCATRRPRTKRRTTAATQRWQAPMMPRRSSGSKRAASAVPCAQGLR